MALLITGASGFIGTHLKNRLKEMNEEIILFTRRPNGSLSEIDSNLSAPELANEFKVKNVEGIIHLASLFLALCPSERVEELVESNVTLGVKLLEASVLSNVKWFLNTGTFWQHFESKEYSPVNLYAASKQAFEVMAKFYVENFGLNYATLKLNDTFGPGDTRRKVVDLLKELATNGNTLDMSPGEQLMSLNHVDEVIDAFISLMNSLRKKEITPGDDFNVYSDQVLSLKKLATMVEEITNKKININWGGREYRPREVMQPWTRRKGPPGWSPRYGLKKGLEIYLS